LQPPFDFVTEVVAFTALAGQMDTRRHREHELD
jgi:hypothetical protein